jgi:hypothetical protein
LVSGGAVEGRAKEEDVDLIRKIALVTEGFPTANRYCKLVLSDRNRLSKENALTVCDYILAMKREINPRLTTISTTMEFLSGFQSLLAYKGDLKIYNSACSYSANPIRI